jgi:hypothetical protein
MTAHRKVMRLRRRPRVLFDVMSTCGKRNSMLWMVIPLAVVAALAIFTVLHQANRSVGEIPPRVKCASNLHTPRRRPLGPSRNVTTPGV